MLCIPQPGIASIFPAGGPSNQFFGRDYQAGLPDSAHLSGMKQKTANIDIRVEPRLVEKIDAWCGRQRAPPSRSAAIVYMHEKENRPPLPREGRTQPFFPIERFP
jgi:hypothetical protein